MLHLDLVSLNRVELCDWESLQGIRDLVCVHMVADIYVEVFSANDPDNSHKHPVYIEHAPIMAINIRTF